MGRLKTRARKKEIIIKAGHNLMDRVLLTPPKTMPKATSGKIQRLAIARMLETGNPGLMAASKATSIRS